MLYEAIFPTSLNVGRPHFFRADRQAGVPAVKFRQVSDRRSCMTHETAFPIVPERATQEPVWFFFILEQGRKALFVMRSKGTSGASSALTKTDPPF